MNKKITDIYKRDFFAALGQKFIDARLQQEMDIKDLNEISGISRIKLESIERGSEKRLLNMNLDSLLNICYALNKKLVISMEELPPEKITRAKLPIINNDDLLKLIATRIK